MRRSYRTQMGERKEVGSNFGLPGNYGLYLVASGIVGLLLWLMVSLLPGHNSPLSALSMVCGLVPPVLTAWMIFGFLLGKPPHYATDLLAGLGKRSFSISEGRLSPGGNPVSRLREKMN
jgi:hypothetical protein